MAPRSLDVLCVDDDPDNRAIIALSLSLDPLIAARVVADAGEATALLAGGFRPDLLVIDPRLIGAAITDLIERLRSAAGGEPSTVVFLTTAVRAPDLDAYRRAGAAGTIAKPFDPLTLAARMRHFAGSAA